MKKLSFFLMAMILSFAASIQAAEVTETIAMKKFGGLSTSSYENVTKTGTSDLGTEMVAYAFNPNTGQIRGNKTTIAGASITTKDDSKNWSLYNTQAMPGAIKKITVTQTETGSNKFKNSMYVALGTTNQGAVTTVTGAQKNTTGTAAEFTFDIDETQGYTYFKLLSNVKFTSGSVKGVVVTVTYVTAEGGEEEVTKYTVTANVNDPAMGAVSGAGEYAEGKTATLTANANPGYKFVNWSNGSTDNPLKITVTEDIEITANFEAIPPMTCAEAAAAPKDAVVVLNPFDVVAVVKGAGYIYIKDESGVNLIYDFNLDDQLKAGDHVEGFVGVSSPYNGLPELKPSVAFADLTVTPGTAPEPTLFTEVPVKADVNKYVKFKNVTLTDNATFTTSSATNATMVVNGTNVTLRNAFKLAATLSTDKAYNIVGFVAVYNSTIQVYFLSVEEYVDHTITVSANPTEAGTITGGGEFEETDEITVKATANEGYEFVNWTENEVEVSTDAEYTFEVLADRALVANFKKSVVTITETYTLPAEAADTNKGGQWYVAVSVEEQDKYQIIIPGYNGPGTYDGEDVLWRVNVDDEWTTMHATVTVTYDEENNLDVYVISATTEDGSTIYNVTLKVGHKAIEEEPEMPVIPLESYMPIVTKITENWGDEIEPWWITSYIWKNGEYDPMEFNLTVTISEYFTELTGYIGNEEVIAFEGAELIAGDEEGYAVLRAQATDGANIYIIDLVAELTTEEEGGKRILNVKEAEIYPNEDDNTALEIYGWSDTEEQVIVTLWDGTSKLYGEYTDLTVKIGNGWNNDYDLLDETTATFSLVDDLAEFKATVVNGKDTVELTVSGTPWVHPNNILPTDTINHTILNGTIGIKYNMFLSIAGESDDVIVNVSTMDKTATAGNIADCSDATLTIEGNAIKLLRGTFEIQEVGDVKIAYIGALGSDHKWYNITLTTGSEDPTALENLTTTVAPAKAIVNGQLVIIKNGVQYNAQGAVVK